MLRYAPVLFPFLFAGCTSKDGTGDDSSAVTDSSDADTDTDSDTDADSDTDSDTDADSDADSDTDTDTDTEPSTTITFNFDGDWSGQLVTMTWFDVRTRTAESLAFGDTLGTWAATSDPLTVTPDAPAETEFGTLDTKGAPDMRTAFYVVSLFTDSDGDGLRAGQEPWTGVATTLAVYVDGTIPSTYTAAGIVPGWNALVFTADSVAAEAADNFPVPANLLSVDTLSFGGTWSVADEASRYGLAALPGSVFTGGSVESYVLDQPMTDPFTATITGDPPEDHQQELDIPGSNGALEIPVAYFDITDDDAYASGDVLAHGVCLSGGQVVSIWVAPPTSLATAYTYANTGRVVGWGLYAAATGEALTDAEAGSLEITDTCPLG